VAEERAAGQFVQSVLRELGEVVDTGDLSKLAALIYQVQMAAYSPPDEDPRWKYDDAPFAPLTKPLS
jgi:hypothetical protein